ncbi:MAG: histidinol-phosphate transaminase [Spirochaetaceae bacterium]|jgi:histidinol-phosphate aminotransferase|nr:histidinol-phosphate transaminase [Spirochaetaceae bacterium]
MINIVTPKQYVNEPGALAKAGDLVTPLAKRVFIIGSSTALSRALPALSASLDAANVAFATLEYTGYPTHDKAKDIARQAAEFKAEAIMGVGGGRIMDLAKASGGYATLPVVTVPTIAATCACWAAVSVMYSAEGIMTDALYNENSPELIIADTDIISRAPLRYLRSGIGDTLAKWYESYPNLKTNNDFYVRLVTQYGAFSRDILETLGLKVVRDLENGAHNTAEIIEVIDCIFVLAGLCGMVRGLADTQGIAHPFYNACSALPPLREKLHGEKVAFALLVQAALEDRESREIAHRVAIFKALKLPITLAELGLEPNFDANFKVIEPLIKKSTPIYAGLLRPWTTEELREAIITADKYARRETTPDSSSSVCKKSLDSIAPFKAARSIESAKREFGFSTIIKLAGNENMHGASPKVIEAIAGMSGEIAYYPDTGATQLRAALSAKLGIEPNELLFGNGSFELISLVALAALEPGAQAIIPQPSFGWYTIATRAEGATPVFVPLRNHRLDLDAILGRITPKTRLIWLCNPNNPTGSYVPGTELESFLQQIPPDILVALDDAYIDFAPPDAPDTIKLVRRFANVISLRTFSKIYGLASLRIGYAIGNAPLIEKIARIRAPVNVNAFAQTAALAALQDDEFCRRVLSENAKGKALYHKTLDRLGIEYIPTACNFIMINTGKNADDLETAYLKHGILVRNGNEFSMPTWIRITIGTQEQNQKVLEILEKQVLA